jgi:hypothetical protein
LTDISDSRSCLTMLSHMWALVSALIKYIHGLPHCLCILEDSVWRICTRICLTQHIHSTLTLWLPTLLQKLYSSRKLSVQLLLLLLLRWLKLLGRLLLLNSTVLVPILMHTVRTLITEAFMKALKVIPIKSGPYLLTAINVLVRGQVRRAHTDTGKVTLRFHVFMNSNVFKIKVCKFEDFLPPVDV